MLHEWSKAIGGRTFPCELCDSPDSIVVQSTNKIRFHICVSPRRKEWVEHALQLDILHDGQGIGKWLPEFPQWFQDLPSLRRVSAVASGYRKDWCAIRQSERTALDYQFVRDSLGKFSLKNRRTSSALDAG